MANYQIDNNDIDFVGIGKIMINTNSKPWNIPQLHFLVTKLENHFEAICLEFGLISSGDTQEKSAEHLVEHIVNHIGMVMANNAGFDEFKDLAQNSFMNDYWALYRHIEFCLAETKRDLSHDMEDRITKAVQDLFDDKVRQLIAFKAKEAADEAIREYEKMSVFKINSVSYASLEVAA